jgi:hypothetical protein
LAGIESNGLIRATIVNKQAVEERVLSVDLLLENKRGEYEKYDRVRAHYRASKPPCIMAPRSSFEVEYLLSMGAIASWGVPALMVSVLLEDETEVFSEKIRFKQPS